MKLINRLNSRSSSRITTSHILVASIAFLLALGLLAPRHVEARDFLEIAMPVEGDPGDGFECDGGGSSGGGTWLPPDDGNTVGGNDGERVSPTFPTQFVWLDNILVHLNLAPHLFGNTLVWTPSFFEMSMPGGGK